MNYNVIPIERFKKEAKRLIRKYPSLKKELGALISLLLANSTAGTSLETNPLK